MNSAELDQLTSQVDHLMNMVETLQDENILLRQKIATHIKERTYLQHKNQLAAKNIRQIIKQMKEA